MPSSMPPEGRVTKFIRAHWRREKSGEILEDLYECFENCFCVEGSQTTPPVDYHRYSDVNDSCITISDVQENEIFSLELLVNPDIEYSPRTVTFALQLQTINGTYMYGLEICNDIHRCMLYAVKNCFVITSPDY